MLTQMKRSWLTVIQAAILGMAGTSLNAAVSLPPIFSNDMVLQRDQPIPIWGWADPGEAVVADLAGAKASTVAGIDGRWKLALPKTSAGGPFVLTITATNTVTFANVLVGEVWVASGQSNMDMSVGHSAHAKEELALADHPRMRLFLTPKSSPGLPTHNMDNHPVWQVCTPESVIDFSAAAYYCGRDIHQKLDVPVGLIQASVGATQIQAWTPRSGYASVPEFSDVVKDIDRSYQGYLARYGAGLDQIERFIVNARHAQQSGKPLIPFPHMYHNHDGGGPGMLYNGMVAPIAPYGIRGVLWYQGETNCGDKQYDIRMKALIAGWRQEWGLGDFPFYFVQLAPFHYDNDNPTKLPEMWRLQTAAMLTIPNTGMVVINDVAPPNNIHPQNKREVGQRLALWALAKTYGFTNLEYSGPLFKALTIDGNKARISFTHATGGLASRDGKALGWITIAGADHVFVPATAVIDGETLVVSAPSVSQPVAVRYAWDQDAQPNLMNKSGLPAPAFDSDTWPGR